MKKTAALIAAAVLACGLLTACGNGSADTNTDSQTVSESSAADSSSVADTSSEAETVDDSVLKDGVYTVEFNTDSSMFHVNEVMDGKGTLTVKDGEMTLHAVLVSKNIVNLYPGTAEEAQAEGAVLLEPVTEEVTYSDGATEEVYAFDIPVPAIDQEFDCALIGKKGVWYDHKVSVTNPVPVE